MNYVILKIISKDSKLDLASHIISYVPTEKTSIRGLFKLPDISRYFQDHLSNNFEVFEKFIMNIVQTVGKNYSVVSIDNDLIEFCSKSNINLDTNEFFISDEAFAYIRNASKDHEGLMNLFTTQYSKELYFDLFNAHNDINDYTILDNVLMNKLIYSNYGVAQGLFEWVGKEHIAYNKVKVKSLYVQIIGHVNQNINIESSDGSIVLMDEATFNSISEPMLDVFQKEDNARAK